MDSDENVSNQAAKATQHAACSEAIEGMQGINFHFSLVQKLMY